MVYYFTKYYSNWININSRIGNSWVLDFINNLVDIWKSGVLHDIGGLFNCILQTRIAAIWIRFELVWIRNCENPEPVYDDIEGRRLHRGFLQKLPINKIQFGSCIAIFEMQNNIYLEMRASWGRFWKNLSGNWLYSTNKNPPYVEKKWQHNMLFTMAYCS